jgi:hypothetical protein
MCQQMKRATTEFVRPILRSGIEAVRAVLHANEDIEKSQVFLLDQELFFAVLFGVSLHRLFGVPSSMNHVTPRCVSMVCRLLVMSGLMMLGRFTVVASGMRQMF